MREPAALSRTINQLKGGPSLSESIVITVFEDAIAPPGGSVWLGKSGMCLTCRVRLVVGKAELDIDNSLDPSKREPGFILACQAKPASERVVVDYGHG
jgi:hypothetical protein